MFPAHCAGKALMMTTQARLRPEAMEALRAELWLFRPGQVELEGAHADERDQTLAWVLAEQREAEARRRRS